MSRKQIVAGVFSVICGFLLPISSVLAVSSGGFGGRPANPDPDNPRSQSIFIYTLEGGETKEDQVLVTNNSSEEATISIYAVDGVVTNTGAYTCRQASEPRVGVGEWLKLSEDTITLDSMERQLVDFTLTMPENADVGEHNGCIVFESADDEGEAVNGGAVRLRTRSAIRVSATIPGELRRNIDIDSFAASVGAGGKQDYALTLQNNGNVSADVDTKVTLTNMFGDIVYENGGGYPVFANQKLDLNFTNDKQPFWGGWFTAKASVSYDKRAGTFGTDDTSELITKESEEVSLFIAPSPLALIIILVPIGLLLVLIVWLVLRRLARRRTERQWGEYAVSAGDTIESVALAHKVRWQKLASINNIKAPYGLKKGQKLKVPAAGLAVAKEAQQPTVATDDIDELIDSKPKVSRRDPKKPGHKNTTKQK